MFIVKKQVKILLQRVKHVQGELLLSCEDVGRHIPFALILDYKIIGIGITKFGVVHWLLCYPYLGIVCV